MKKAYLIAIVLALCIGVYFLGEGITGLIISKNCCFGDSCALENQCQNQPVIESPTYLAPREDFTLATTLILFSSIIFVNLYRKKRNNMHKQMDSKLFRNS